MEQKYAICFVCTGNACRSPFAECVLKSMLKQEGMDNIEVFSRGTLDWGENPRDANMARIARELGYDLKGMTTPLLVRSCRRQTALLSLMRNTVMPLPECLTMRIGTGLSCSTNWHLVQIPQLWIRTIRLTPYIRVWPRILWKGANG